MAKRFTFLLCLTASILSFAQGTYSRTLKLMGSRFDITVVAEDSTSAASYIDLAVGEITRIEKLISSWDMASQTSMINKNAGIKPIQADRELFDLIDRAVRISELTDGGFDITYASMDRIWKFDGSMKEMPSPEDIASSVKLVGFKNIQLDSDSRTVFLTRKGMKIGFGAIG